MNIVIALFSVISAVLAIVALIFWLYCLVEISKSQFKSKVDKVVWVILMITMPVLGTILYLAFGRQNRIDSFEEYV